MGNIRPLRLQADMADLFTDQGQMVRVLTDRRLSSDQALHRAWADSSTGQLQAGKNGVGILADRPCGIIAGMMGDGRMIDSGLRVTTVDTLRALLAGMDSAPPCIRKGMTDSGGRESILEGTANTIHRGDGEKKPYTDKN